MIAQYSEILQLRDAGIYIMTTFTALETAAILGTQTTWMLISDSAMHTIGLRTACLLVPFLQARCANSWAIEVDLVPVQVKQRILDLFLEFVGGEVS
jgi:hypothetical protein